MEVSALIAKTLRTTNSKDYSPEYIENDMKKLGPEQIKQRAGWTHFYVVCDGDKIVGCGAIGSYWGKTDESSLFTIFVLPEYQGKGVGRSMNIPTARSKVIEYGCTFAENKWQSIDDHLINKVVA